ncbi:myo-inosose-2 dehydratase [Erwinia papayae]|uniref:Myo-inosose-2 dehydratase n=1 Tax=Erwinia papayae TaxID=206499 RepID=A0ABV3N1X9_9GAMM
MCSLKNGNIHIAVSPLSWANEVIEEFGRDVTADICLTGAAAAGYDGVEMSRLFPREAAALSAMLAKHGLRHASGWHSGLLSERSVTDELAAVAPFAHLLKETGAKVLIYGECGHMPENALDIGMRARLRLTPTALQAYGDKLTAFADALDSVYGLSLAYHHHLMMVVETLEEVRALMSVTGPSVGLLVDTGHAFAAGFDYRILLSEFTRRINHIHLKDVRGEILRQVRDNDLSFNQAVRKGLFTVPGDGIIDFSPLVHFVNETQYQGWIVVEAEQDPSFEPPEITVSRARQFILNTFSL